LVIQSQNIDVQAFEITAFHLLSTFEQTKTTRTPLIILNHDTYAFELSMSKQCNHVEFKTLVTIRNRFSFRLGNAILLTYGFEEPPLKCTKCQEAVTLFPKGQFDGMCNATTYKPRTFSLLIRCWILIHDTRHP